MKDIEENEKRAELKRIWNAIHEIKSLLSKHIADNPLKRDPKRPVKHFITDYFEKKSSNDYFKHIDIKTKREQVFTKKIDELEVKLKLLEKEKSVLIQKVKNLESENSKLRTAI